MNYVLSVSPYFDAKVFFFLTLGLMVLYAVTMTIFRRVVCSPRSVRFLKWVGEQSQKMYGGLRHG